MSALRYRLAILTCTSATFLVNVDNTSYSVALPAIEKSFGASAATAQWFVTAYVLTLAAGVTLAGALGDKLSKRLVLLAGLCLYVAGSIASSLAPSAETLIAARVLAGLGGCALVPIGLALVRDLSRTEEELRANTALWGVVVGVGMATGPLIGGAATTFTTWRVVPMIGAVVGILFFAAVLLVIPRGDDDATSSAPLDWRGQLLACTAMVSLVFGLTSSGHDGSPVVIGGTVALFVAATVLFVLHVRRAASPLLPAEALGSARYRLGLSSGAANYVCVGGTILFAALLLQGLGGLSSLAAGSVIVTLSVATTVGGWLSKRVLDATSVGTSLTLAGAAIGIGSLVGAAGTAGFSSAALVPVVMVALAVSGVGMGLANSATNIMSMTGLARTHSGRAGAFASASRQLGQAVGITVVSITVNASGLDESVPASVTWLVLLAGALVVVAVGLRVRSLD